MPVQASERQSTSARAAPYPTAGPSCPHSPRKLRLLAAAASHSDATNSRIHSEMVQGYAVSGNEGVQDIPVLTMPLNGNCAPRSQSRYMMPPPERRLSHSFIQRNFKVNLSSAMSSDPSPPMQMPSSLGGVHPVLGSPSKVGKSTARKSKSSSERTLARVHKARKIVNVRRPNGTMATRELDVPTLEPCTKPCEVPELPHIPESVTPAQIKFYQDARQGYTSKGDSLPYYQLRSPLAYASVDEARSGFPYLPSRTTVPAKERKIPYPRKHLQRLKTTGIERRRNHSSKNHSSKMGPAESVTMTLKRYLAKKIRTIIRSEDPDLLVLRRTEASLAHLYRQNQQARDPAFLRRAMSFRCVTPEPVGQVKEWMEYDGDSDEEEDEHEDEETEEDESESDSDEDEWVSDADSEDDEDEESDQPREDDEPEPASDVDVDTEVEEEPSSSTSFRFDLEHLRFLVKDSQIAKHYEAVRLERIQREQRKMDIDWSDTYQRKHAQQERKRRMEQWRISPETCS